MKILIIFIDMVRVDHLNTYNSLAHKCLLDQRLEQLGGTLFTRCYSPGPDTPRSLACMQSGLYPYFNGCNTRIRWPKFFMNEEITTIWDHAAEKNMAINLCCNENEYLTGFFKFNESPNINVFLSPKEFIENGAFDDSSLSFIGIPDMHTAIGDYKASDYAFRKGDEIVNEYFERYLTKDFIEEFDYTIIFSDHGFQMENERNHLISTLELLNDSRNQLLLLLHKSKESQLVKDNRLASMVDLYSTIEELIGGTDYRQGFSLKQKPKREITHVEDHQDFNVYPEIMVKQWRVISDSFDIRTDVRNTTIFKGCDKNIEDLKNYLHEYSPTYDIFVKQLTVLDYYKEINNNINRFYFIGDKRASKFILFFIKAYTKMRHYISLLKR